MQTEKVWESQGNYFTKIPITIGDYINRKGIGIRNKDIPRTEYRWIDTDYTVHPSKNHPPIPPVHGNDAISWILAHNRKYSIGKVVDIHRTTADNGIHTLKGTVKFQEPKLAKQAYEMGVIPLYNSSSIYENARDEKTGLTTDYIPIDNCAVDEPAGDLELFKTGAFCEGGNECIHDLKQSGINSECGYCKLEALKSLKFHYPIEAEIHDSHNSTNLQQSSSMSNEQSTAGIEPDVNTTKKTEEGKNAKSAKGKDNKGAETAKTDKTINDSGWVSSKEDETEEDTNTGDQENEGEEASKKDVKEKPVDYKKLYETEKAKNDSTTKTVTELLAESRHNKLKDKFNVLPIEIWEGDEKAKAKDIDFFNSLYDKTINEELLNKILEKYVSKIPIKALNEIKHKVKQSGMTALDLAMTHDFIARTESQNEGEQFTEADSVLGALED